jgi:BRCT domain type II-containing protein
MIESFGGKVTGSLSGKTNFLVVGKEPGRVKVTDATKRRLPRIDLMALQNRMLGRIESLEAAKPAVIKAFSAGYNAYNLTNG